MHNYFIKRKVTTIVTFLLIILFGIISLGRLKMDLLPDISFPTLTIITLYNNVAPSEIETLVTIPIEEMLSSVSGVDRISSESIEGVSIITVRFRWGIDMDQASIQTREKVDLVKGSLPQDVKKSIVVRFDPNNAPILQLAIEPIDIPLKDMRFFLKKNVIPYFERVDGIAAISVSGGLERQILVKIDRGKLDAYNTTIFEIVSQLEASNFNFPAGNIKNGDKEVLVRTNGAFRDIETIGKTVIGATKEGIPFYLNGIGLIEDGYKERTSISKFNNNECIALVLKKEAGKNTVAVADATIELIEELNEKFKGKIKISIVSDQSIFIRESINSVANSGLLAIFICYFVLLFFLGSFKEPIVVIAAVPISIMITFIFMFFKGITLNTMSLGGLATGIGMVVDSATVVLESIYQKRKENLSNLDAALQGTGEVVGSVIASTITSCVVFLPIVFVEGIAGAIFKEFALTITFSLVSSLIVSVTLVPVLSLFPFFTTLNLDSEIQSNKRTLIINKIGKFFEDLTIHFYYHKAKLILVSIAILIITFIIFTFIPAELMPEVDQGHFTIKVVAEEGTPLKATLVIIDDITNIIESQKFAEKIFSKVGYEERDIIINPKGDFGINRGDIYVKLNAGISTNIAIEKIRKQITEVEESTRAKINFIPAKSILSEIFAGGGSGITIEVTGQDIDGIKKICREIESEFINVPFLTDVNTSFRDESPEFRVELDRDKMAYFGLNVDKVASTLKAALKGEVATKFRQDDYEFDVLVRLQEFDRIGTDSIRELNIKLPVGKNIKLESFADIIPSKMSRKIIRAEGKRIGIIYANFIDIKQSDVYNKIAPILAKYESYTEYSVLPGEVDKETNKSFKSLSMAGILAIILIYMTMASQFENFILPLIVMLSIIMDGLGIGLGLFVFRHSINIVSIMGIVMLGGLVVNNAIILIEFFQQNETNFSSEEQIIRSSIKRRINTILNTSATTILGLIPTAFGIGGESPQGPMAVAVIGGLLISTVLTIIIIPIAYFQIVKLKTKTND